MRSGSLEIWKVILNSKILNIVFMHFEHLFLNPYSLSGIPAFFLFIFLSFFLLTCVLVLTRMIWNVVTITIIYFFFVNIKSGKGVLQQLKWKKKCFTLFKRKCVLNMNCENYITFVNIVYLKQNNNSNSNKFLLF